MASLNPILEVERYARQVLLWGEQGQAKLAAAKVTILGAGHLGKYTAMPLAALGVGEIRLLEGRTPCAGEAFLDIPLAPLKVEKKKARGSGIKRLFGLGEEETKAANESRPISAVKGIEKGLERINPNVQVLSIAADLETRLGQEILEDSDVVIDMTNNPRSKALALDWAQKSNCPAISSSVGEGYGRFTIYHPGEELKPIHFMPDFAGQAQNPLISLLFGGIAAEEVKKMILDEPTAQRPLYYKLGPRDRFSFLKEQEQIVPARKSFQDRSALVIGAGALGNIVAIALAEMGLGRTVYVDDDTVDSTNLNRQVLFYDAVGEPKAEILARKHGVMNPNAEVYGQVLKLELSGGQTTLDDLGAFDVGFDLVDNRYTRAIFLAYAVRKKMNLITAGTDPIGAAIAAYVPGKTSCFAHLWKGYYEKGLEDEARRRQSCILQPDPSVIMTNQVAAALAALESFRVLDPKQYGNPFNGTLRYDANLDYRLGSIPINKVCDCEDHLECLPNLEI